jgi:osmotically-inducible protein OsmY
LAGSLAWVDDVTAVNTDNLLVDPMFDRNASVVTTAVTDDLVREDILLAMLYEPRVDAFDITVRVEGGVAYLSGTVDNLMARRAAERVAGTTRGVYRVENFITVGTPADAQPLTIAENFKRNAALDPVLSSENVALAVEGTKGILTGEVDTPYERQRAASIASRQRGIDHIENRITLAAHPLKPDAELLVDIRNELTWSPYVDADDIEVSVEDGVATLRGDVASWLEHKAAVENAYEGGARRVVSKMLVAGGAPEHVPYEGLEYQDYTRPYWEY